MGEIKDRKICARNEREEWKALNARFGGASAPRDVLSGNLKLYNAFRCLDYYVGIEKSEKGFQYILNWRGGSANISSTPLGPYDPRRPHALRENMFILETSPPSANVKSFKIVPMEGFRHYWNSPGEMEGYYLLPHFVSMTGRQLIRDYYLFAAGAVDSNFALFYLDLVLAKDDWQFAFDELSIVGGGPEFKPVLAMGASERSPVFPFLPSIQWPWDQFYLRGVGDGKAGRPEAGIRFFEPNVALDVGVAGTTEKKYDRFSSGALSAGVRYAERVPLHSRASLEVSAGFEPSLRLEHTGLLLPPWVLSGKKGPGGYVRPFAGLSHGLGSRETRLIGGLEIGGFGTGTLDPLDRSWNDLKATALLWDQGLLALTAGQLAWELRKTTSTHWKDINAGGIGFFAGEILFLDSLLIDAYQKRALGGAWPWASVGVKGPAALAAAYPLPHFASSLFLGGAVSLTQILGEIDPESPAWILGHTVLGSGLVLADTHGMAGSEALEKHLRSTGTMLLTYGLRLWIHANGWDRF